MFAYPVGEPDINHGVISASRLVVWLRGCKGRNMDMVKPWILIYAIWVTIA